MTNRILHGALVGLLSAVAATAPFAGAWAGNEPDRGIPSDRDHAADSLDSWVLGYGVDAPCEAISFCETCINTCVVSCLSHGGQALATCRITTDDCTCICECKRPTQGIQAV